MHTSTVWSQEKDELERGGKEKRRLKKPNVHVYM